MTTPKYTYKGVNIDILVAGTTNTTLTGYVGFPSYESASSYSTERPLPFGITQQGTDVSTKMNATYINFAASTSGTYTIPTEYTHFRAILEGAGGGGGGSGGEGQPSSKNGGAGKGGAIGEFVYASDIPINLGATITYSVGTGGGLGKNGRPADDKNQDGSAKGDDGGDGSAGNATYISFGSYQIGAYGGGGGGGGNGGTQSSSGGTTNGPGNANVDTTYNTGVTRATDANINPLGYASTVSNGGGQATGGQGGYLRIYLLKE
jgi:hypothetical protein